MSGPAISANSTETLAQHEDIEVRDVHEAFSVHALGVLRELPTQFNGFRVPDEKLTPTGALAIGSLASHR
jgi:hypothetical protein